MAGTRRQRAYLVVIEAGSDRLRYTGQGIGPGTSAERISEIYTDLHDRSRLARPRRVLGSPDIGQC